MEFVTLNLDKTEIDIQKSQRFRTSFGRSDFLLTENIKTFGIFNPLIFRADGKRLELINGFRRYEIAAINGINTIPANIFSNSELTDVLAISLTITLNFFERGFNEIEKANIIRNLREKFKFDTFDILQQFKEMLSLNSGSKVLEVYEEISRFPETIKNKSVQLNLPLNLLSVVTQIDPEIAEIFFDEIVIGCKANYNEAKEIANLLKDISIEKGKRMKEIYEMFIKDIIMNEKIEPKRKNVLIRDKLRKIKFPVLSRVEENFKSAVKKLGLEKNLDVIPEKNFEGDEVEFKIKSRSQEEFSKIINQLKKSLERGEIEEIYRSFRNYEMYFKE